MANDTKGSEGKSAELKAGEEKQAKRAAPVAGMARVSLKRSYRYGTVIYGPGADLDVPEGLADALGLSEPREPMAEDTRAKGRK